MSAYVCDLNHITYLVQAGTAIGIVGRHSTLSWVWDIDQKTGTYKRSTLPRGDHAKALRVGQMLWDENVKSVQARYPGDRELPGPIDCDYQYSNSVPLFYVFAPVQVIKACDCYAYQSCEHDEWKTSEAKAYIDALRLTACRHLPGYEDARWGAPQLRNQSKVRLA